MENVKKMIFFDFDGVIADSFSAAFAVNKMMYPSLTADDYQRRFDGNINESTSNLSQQGKSKSDTDFFKEYGPMLLQSEIFADMEKVIKKITTLFTLIIISSTTTDLIKKYLKLHGLDECFIEVMGNDIHKSKIKKIEMALDKYKVNASDCRFITDTLGGH